MRHNRPRTLLAALVIGSLIAIAGGEIAAALPPPAPSHDEMQGLIGETWAVWTFDSAQPYMAGAEWGEAASTNEQPHFEHSAVEPSPTLHHTVNATGLRADTAYHVRLFARNPAGETNFTEPFVLLSCCQRAGAIAFEQVALVALAAGAVAAVVVFVLWKRRREDQPPPPAGGA